jgi:hypothetical protein
MDESIYFKYPFSRASLRHAEIPFLLIFLNAEVEIFNVIYWFSSDKKNVFEIKFGKNFLFVLRFE